MSERTLHEAFLADHRALMQGLAGIGDAVTQDDVGRAVDQARMLDRTAGPHIAFEEECLLPAMEREFGVEFVAHLRGEHAVGQAALGTLLHMENRRRFEPEERRVLLDQLEAAVDHAFSIGTLLSHLDSLSDETQKGLMQCLDVRKRRCRRWLDQPIESRG